MNLRIVDINVLVEDSVRALLPVAGETICVRTALAHEELKVVLDPVQMADDLAALLNSAYSTLTKGEIMTIGTSFLPIRTIHGNRSHGRAAGCALLSVDLGLGSRHGGQGTDRPSAPFRSVAGIVKNIGGCARIVAGRGGPERLSLYLPIFRQDLTCFGHTTKTPGGESARKTHMEERKSA
ncbi:MAG: hypothetical protein ABSC19_15875 [Syntrophorhabdales bacterium]|jgi:hypothetical protein